MMTRVFHLSSQYMVSRLMSSLSSVLQVAHIDFHPDMHDKAKSKPFIAMISALSKGSMLRCILVDEKTKN